MTFNLSDEIKAPYISEVIHIDKVKEFIKIVENIIIKRESKRLQLIELGKRAGDKLT